MTECLLDFLQHLRRGLFVEEEASADVQVLHYGVEGAIACCLASEDNTWFVFAVRTGGGCRVRRVGGVRGCSVEGVASAPPFSLAERCTVSECLMPDLARVDLLRRILLR